eukprot:sb/3476218/
MILTAVLRVTMNYIDQLTKELMVQEHVLRELQHEQERRRILQHEHSHWYTKLQAMRYVCRPRKKFHVTICYWRHSHLVRSPHIGDGSAPKKGSCLSRALAHDPLDRFTSPFAPLPDGLE